MDNTYAQSLLDQLRKITADLEQHIAAEKEAEADPKTRAAETLRRLNEPKGPQSR